MKSKLPVEAEKSDFPGIFDHFRGISDHFLTIFDPKMVENTRGGRKYPPVRSGISSPALWRNMKLKLPVEAEKSDFPDIID